MTFPIARCNRPRLRFVPLAALLLASLPARPADASCLNGVGCSVADFLSLVQKIPAVNYGQLGKALGYAGIAFSIRDVGEQFEACMKTGSLGTCAPAVAPAAACAALGATGVDTTDPFTFAASVAVGLGGVTSPVGWSLMPIGYLYNQLFGLQVPYCNKDGTLGIGVTNPDIRCCKYTWQDTGCHSGQLKISCPIDIGPSYNAYPGLTCAPYPACAMPPTWSDTALLKNARFDLGFQALVRAFPTVLKNVKSPPAVAPTPSPTHTPLPLNACTEDALWDFMTFRGCKGYRAILANASPFIPKSAWRPALASYAEPEPRGSISALSVNAAYRVALGLPYGFDRVSYTAGWGPGVNLASELSKYGVTDADAELRKWLGPCGIEVAKQAFGPNYKLLAIPPASATVAGPNGTPAVGVFIDGCPVARPPSLTRVTAATGKLLNAVSLTVEATDPDRPLPTMSATPARSGPGGLTTVVDMNRAVLFVEWGDGNVTAELASATTTLEHVYTSPATRTITAWITNEAGLYASRSVSWAAGTRPR